MSAVREPLKEGSIIRLSNGFCAEITGKPLGEGGGSLIYPAVRVHFEDGCVIREPMHYALKECFPLSDKYPFKRNEAGCIVPETDQEESRSFLASVQAMQCREADITKKIYNVASRMIPILETASEVELSTDQKTFQKINNTFTVMESLSQKGVSLRTFIHENRQGVKAFTALRIIEQVLYALREVHEAKYLHLDIQDGNVFLKGNLQDGSLQATLIDFGSSRQCLEDGLTAPVRDKALFTTRGFSSPEMRKNDGSLRLGPSADLYSAGYLLLMLLTGKRYEPETIAGMQGKNILSPLRMRHTECPSFLAESLQQILRHSLAQDIEDRYHTVAEMLQDVTRLRESLEPARSSLHAVRYDAFICYKHNDLDTPVVKALQNALEHFHIPKEIRKKTGKQRFERIFTDMGELSGCADLGTAIRDALANSDWLIVICSKTTPESIWVCEEIENFLANHDRSHIIPILTEGEPDESFPKEIRSDNNKTVMLAADARGSTREEVIKNIRKDTVLRVAAPMLGVSYDALKQRRRIYMMQHVAAAAAFAVVLMAAITIYTILTSNQIKAAHRETLIRQGELLSERSDALLRQGDRMGAIQAALEALPESSDDDKPVTDEAVYALHNATYAYWDSAFACFQSDYILTTNTTVSQKPVVNPDGSLLALTDHVESLYIYDMSSAKLRSRFSLSDIDSTFADETLSETRFLSDGNLLLKTDNYILCWDPVNEHLLWQFKITANSGWDSKQSVLLVDDDRQCFYLVMPYGSDENHQSVYPVLAGDLKTGKSLLQPDIPKDNDTLNSIQKAVISEDGRYIILAVSSIMDERPCCLIAAESESGNILYEEEIGNDISIRELQVLNDHSVAVLTEAEDYENAAKNSCLKFLSLHDGSLQYEEESSHFYLQHRGIRVFDSVLAVWHEEHLKLIDTGSFQSLQEYQLPAPVLNVAKYKNNSLIAVLTDGSCWRVFIDSRLSFYCGCVEGTFSEVCDYENNGLHFLLSGYSSNRLAAMSEHDYEGFTQPDIGENDSVNSVVYMHADNDWFRIFGVKSGIQDSSGEYLSISRTGSNKILSMTDSKGYKDPIGIFKTDTEDALYYLVQERNGDSTRIGLYAWGITTNKLLGHTELPEAFSLCQTSVSDTHIILYCGNELLIFPIDSSHTAEENFSACTSLTLEEQSIRKVVPLPDNTGFLAQIHTPEETQIKKLNANTGNWEETEISLKANAEILAVSPDSKLAAVQENGLFVLYDLKDGNKADILPESCSTKSRALFIDDRYLLIWGDSGFLKTWDLLQREIVMTDDTEYIWVSSMAKDGDYLQIHTTTINEDILFSRHSADPCVRIYTLKNDGTFKHYFDFASGAACMQTGELTSFGTKIGFTEIMDLDQLIIKAREILMGGR